MLKKKKANLYSKEKKKKKKKHLAEMTDNDIINDIILCL